VAWRVLCLQASLYLVSSSVVAMAATLGTNYTYNDVFVKSPGLLYSPTTVGTTPDQTPASGGRW
jgi:hypothetical protein